MVSSLDGYHARRTRREKKENCFAERTHANSRHVNLVSEVRKAKVNLTGKF